MGPADPELVCPILKVLVNKHRHGGSPLPRTPVLSMAAIPSDKLGDAKETFKLLRTSDKYPFVMNRGSEHVLLDNDQFPALVDYLYEECGWTKFKINNSLRHYDVYDDHDFE